MPDNDGLRPALEDAAGGAFAGIADEPVSDAMYGSLSAYNPSPRDRIASWMIGDSNDPTRQNLVSALMGSRGMGSTGPGLVDVSPAAPIFGVTEGQAAADRGDWIGAGLGALSAIPAGRLAGTAAAPLEFSPQTFYHGTNTYFPQFDVGRSGLASGAIWDRGIWASQSPEFASQWAERTSLPKWFPRSAAGTDTLRLEGIPGAQVRPLSIAPGKQKVIQVDGGYNPGLTARSIWTARLQGYDSVLFKGVRDVDGAPHDQIVVFNPKRIRSKFHNDSPPEIPVADPPQRNNEIWPLSTPPPSFKIGDQIITARPFSRLESAHRALTASGGDFDAAIAAASAAGNRGTVRMLRALRDKGATLKVPPGPWNNYGGTKDAVPVAPQPPGIRVYHGSPHDGAGASMLMPNEGQAMDKVTSASTPYGLRRGGSVKVIHPDHTGSLADAARSKLGAVGYDMSDAGIRAFQQDHDVPESGVIDPMTMGALNGLAAYRLRGDNTFTPPDDEPVMHYANPEREYLRDLLGPASYRERIRGHRQSDNLEDRRDWPPNATEFSTQDNSLGDNTFMPPMRVNRDPMVLPYVDPEAEYVRGSPFAKGGRTRVPGIPKTPAIPKPRRGGLIKSDVAGRTDRLPTAVPQDSYIIPADVVSGLGQGNTDAGAKIIGQILHPHSMRLNLYNRKAQRHPNIFTHRKKSGGGATDIVPIIVAGGEYVIDPDTVRSIGSGDARAGHRILDGMVTSVRRQVADRMKQLPGPKA